MVADQEKDMDLERELQSDLELEEEEQRVPQILCLGSNRLRFHLDKIINCDVMNKYIL